MKVAVIGAGIFGCTAAVDLARAGATVDLYERRMGLIDGATARCQARLHSGYHYPRSDTTAKQARAGAIEFEARYPGAVKRAPNHFYLIAPDSKTSPDEYLAFCERNELPYEIVDKPPHVHTAELVVRVPEAFVDIPTIRRLVYRDLRQANVSTFLNWDGGLIDQYDFIVWATYGFPWYQPLQYEVCEVALVELGRYTGDSYVVLDGDYVSLDPNGHIYALYDVKHSVHATIFGTEPRPLDQRYERLLNALGPKRTRVSRFNKMITSASRYLWGIEPGGQGVSIYHGSWFSIRAVLPNVDGTDERPTLIHYDDKTVSILSGKICTAVSTAREVTQALLGQV
jgi:FAD dependent oxidoreductase